MTFQIYFKIILSVTRTHVGTAICQVGRARQGRTYGIMLPAWVKVDGIGHRLRSLASLSRVSDRKKHPDCFAEDIETYRHLTISDYAGSQPLLQCACCLVFTVVFFC